MNRQPGLSNWYNSYYEVKAISYGEVLFGKKLHHFKWQGSFNKGFIE